MATEPSRDASDAPDDASIKDFCAVWNDDSIGGGDDDTPEEQADAAHEAAGALAEVGSPEGMDDGARNGFEVFLDFLSDVDADDIATFAEANPGDADAFADSLGIDKDDADDVIAFITYASQECYRALHGGAHPVICPSPRGLALLGRMLRE